MILLIRWLLRRRRERRAGEPAGAGPTAASRGRLALVLHQAFYDLRGFLRNRQGRFFTLVLPLLFLVIFVAVFGNNKVGPGNLPARIYYVPGISALAVIAASFVNLVISITVLREEGILKRRRATPVPAWVLIAGRTLMSIAVSLVSMVVLMLVGRFAYGVRLPTRTIPGVAMTAILGSISFCALAYAFSTAIENEDAAQPMVQAVMLPLYFISGVFIPAVTLPNWLRHVAQVFPVQHLSHGLHHAFAPATTGIGIVWSDLGVLALWGAIGLAVALFRFSWLPKAATG
ncbi:MAG TPA: ABC transporter permease [Gaiellaceae bacterium]|nr:ABC transporter permease [Gaiellaceae bacterium]